MSKKSEKVLLAYLATHLIHWLFNQVVDEQAQKRGWSAGQIEFAKILVSSVALAF